MRIAVVGASKLNDNEERDTRQFIALMLKSRMEQSITKDIIVVSGGAEGVDTCAVEVAEGLGLNTLVFKAEVQEWEAPKGFIGFRDRNIQISENCDILYCLPVVKRDRRCYHCDMDHQVSGACWTMKYAKKMGKEVHLISPINR